MFKTILLAFVASTILYNVTAIAAHEMVPLSLHLNVDDFKPSVLWCVVFDLLNY
jgi:hypothetical protein